MHVELRDEARDDLVDGAIFYGEQSADLDRYLLKCLRQDIEKLQSTGGIHEQYRGFHRSLSERFPYGLYSGNQHSRRAEAAVALGAALMAEENDAETRSWQDWCEAAGMTKACRCPICGKTLVSHHAFSSGRDPPMTAFRTSGIDSQEKAA